MEDTDSYRSYLKSPYISIKHSSYFEVYDRLLGPYRNRPITFVEVGVLGGGSLFMWRDFFGPSARIIGVDLNPAARRWEEHGFEIFIGSQSDSNFWHEFRKKVGDVDVLLDDGGHTYAQQVITTECMIDAIRDGGVLVVEDTHTSYMNGFGPRRYSFFQYTKLMLDRINHRSGSIENGTTESRIWSVQIFESIVAFHVNRVASNAACFQTTNGRPFDGTLDFRNFDRTNPRLRWLKDLFGPSLRRVPGLIALYSFFRDWMDLKKTRIDKFFR